MSMEQIESICKVHKAKKGDHYQSALPFNRILSKGSDPMTVAEKLIKNIPACDSISNVSVVAKGFLNFELAPKWSMKCLPKVVEKPWSKPLGKKALVDYTSPNMAKEMHVGHLRSMVQGEFICRILERIGGFEISRVSHVGDFGTPLGNLIAYCNDIDQSFEATELSTAEELTNLYVQASKQAKEDPEFPAKGLKVTMALQKGEDKSIESKWKRICEVSRSGFDENMKWFNVHPTERGESFYKDKLPGVVSHLQKEGLASESDGAQCVFVPVGKKVYPYVIQKKDKSFLYATTDLAALQFRTQELGMERIVYVTDTAQQLHFQQLFVLADKLGWNYLPNGSKVQLDHAYFGAVLGEDGTRMKSREGAPVKLKDFIKQAEDKAHDAIQNASFNSGKTDVKRVAQAAIKFYELSNQRTQDYKFSFQHMMQFHGCTGAYLLYAYSRMVSIIEKHKGEPFVEDMLALDPNVVWDLSHKSEISLVTHLISFWDVLDYSLQQLSSNPLSDYLFVLASKFSSFYEHCPVLQSDNVLARMELCKATTAILLRGFEILNIRPTRL